MKIELLVTSVIPHLLMEDSLIYLNTGRLGTMYVSLVSKTSKPDRNWFQTLAKQKQNGLVKKLIKRWIHWGIVSLIITNKIK